MRAARVRIADEDRAIQVLSCAAPVAVRNEIERQAATEAQRRVDRPALCQPLKAARGTGYFVLHESGEVVARVEIAVAVVSVWIGAVLRSAAEAVDIQRVCPGVVKLRDDAVLVQST